VANGIEAHAADALFCWCRPGFEPELAAELTERAALANVAGYARTQRSSGFVEFIGDEAEALSRALPFESLIFARQKLLRLADLRGIDAKDRIAPILAALDAQASVSLGAPYGELWVEHPDSDEGKPLAGLARSFGNALRPALRARGLLAEAPDPRRPRLHVCFLGGDALLAARADPADSAPWPLGIPRLKMHPDAPSRSALKLEEALLTLLDDRERAALLRSGMRAADLGAAPGGWTWVLAREGLRVTAIDNGPLRQHVLDTGLVEHLRADGFAVSYLGANSSAQGLIRHIHDIGPRAVLLSCSLGWCERAIFNLKLPMKKRWMETRLCLGEFAAQARRPLLVRARQLYHDREEITVFASIQPGPRGLTAG